MELTMAAKTHALNKHWDVTVNGEGMMTTRLRNHEMDVVITISPKVLGKLPYPKRAVAIWREDGRVNSAGAFHTHLNADGSVSLTYAQDGDEVARLTHKGEGNTART